MYGLGHFVTDLSVLNELQYKEPFVLLPLGGSGGFDKDGRPRVYRRALHLLERGTIEVAPLIKHRYKSLDKMLDKMKDAFEADFSRPEYTKGVVNLSSGSLRSE